MLDGATFKSTRASVAYRKSEKVECDITLVPDDYLRYKDPEPDKTKIKNAIKRYKIENTRKIYSLPFSGVYKVIGKYCDEDYYVNGSIREVQKEFIDKMRK